MRAQEVDGEFANEGGKIGDRGWLEKKVVTVLPKNVIKRIRAWDTAGSEKKTAKESKSEMRTDLGEELAGCEEFEQDLRVPSAILRAAPPYREALRRSLAAAYRETIPALESLAARQGFSPGWTYTPA